MTSGSDRQLCRLTATDAHQAVRTGEATVEAIVRNNLDRLHKREPGVKAWAHVVDQHALDQARTLDDARDDQPLQGVTVGVKDVIDTADMPTEYNSDLYRGFQPSQDAACVKRLRHAGAVILGKTETTEFAHAHPTRTTNPHDAKHSPGGSSSGSAAAVADYMVATALGTQTGGSTIRPAAFCGVYALKPSHGLIDVAGLKPLAHSLDTIGLFARSVADLELLLTVLANGAGAHPSETAQPILVLCRTDNWGHATAPAQERLTEAADVLRDVGTTVRELTLPPAFHGLGELHQTVMAFETALAFRTEWETGRDSLSKSFAAFIEQGLSTTQEQYTEAAERAAELRTTFADLLDANEVMLTLSATGEAPLGLAHTGNAVFNRPWTLLHGPALHVPWGRGPQGLPLGVQLVTATGRDRQLLAAAHWVVKKLSAANPR